MLNPLLEVHDLGCVRNNNRLFSGLSLSLMPGEVLQIMGHNGSGKSSLLKLLSGLLPLEYGKVTRDSDDLLYIGHKLGIKLALTVMENVSEMSVLHKAVGYPYNPHPPFGHPLPQAGEGNLSVPNRGEGREALERLGLMALADRPCLYLSAGQRQRLALARLFFIKRKLWILDEPFAHLDQPNSDILIEEVNRHCRKGGAVVLATHRSFDFTAKQQVLCLS